MNATVYRPMLVRRLVCIEKKLKIPPGERHRCEGKLLKSEEIYMEGVRVRKMSEDFVASFPNGKGSATPVTPEPVNKAWGSLTPMSAKSDNTSAEGRARGPVTVRCATLILCYRYDLRIFSEGNGTRMVEG